MTPEPQPAATPDPAPEHPLLASPEARAILGELERRLAVRLAGGVPVPGETLAGLEAGGAPHVAGWQTSEFWLSVLALVGVFALILAGKTDAQTGLLIIATIVPGYAVSRGLTKRGIGAVAAGILLALCVLPGCGTVSQAGAEYRRVVAAQSFTVTADGQRQTIGAGTTIYFRDPAQGALPAPPAVVSAK